MPARLIDAKPLVPPTPIRPPTFADPDGLARFLREPSLYPPFAESVAGKNSLSVISADSYDSGAGEVILLGGGRRAVGGQASSLLGGADYLIQRRLNRLRS